MRRLILTPLAVLVVLAGLSVFSAYRRVSAADPVSAARFDADVSLVPDADLLRGIVPSRTTIAGLFRDHAIAGAEAGALVAAIGGRFDVRRIRAGQPYLIDRMFDGRVRRFEYEIDADRRLLGTRAALDGPPRFVTSIEPIPKVVTIVEIEGRIDRSATSLTAAIDRAGEGIDLALELADVFSGEIDFNSDLQPGDHFRLLVERQTREGAPAGYGAILAAEFANDGRELQAIRFRPDGGAPAYYDAQGRSLKRFFLKSPLKFEPRVTSRFSGSRKHPILGYSRAHNGVDYGAPSGSPVASVAPGVVTLAGWTRGGGRTVRVRHPNGYESEYLHLSSMAVRAGMRLGQGELVGRVGATGLATGPHLHYGLRKNGAFVNPLTEHRNMPPGDPVPTRLLASFNTERDRWMGLLAGLGTARAANE